MRNPAIIMAYPPAFRIYFWAENDKYRPVQFPLFPLNIHSPLQARHSGNITVPLGKVLVRKINIADKLQAEILQPYPIRISVNDIDQCLADTIISGISSCRFTWNAMVQLYLLIIEPDYPYSPLLSPLNAGRANLRTDPPAR